MKVLQKEEHGETLVDKGEDKKKNANKENLEQINAPRRLLLIAINVLLQRALLCADNSLSKLVATNCSRTPSYRWFGWWDQVKTSTFLPQDSPQALLPLVELQLSHSLSWMYVQS